MPEKHRSKKSFLSRRTVKLIIGRKKFIFFGKSQNSIGIWRTPFITFIKGVPQIPIEFGNFPTFFDFFWADDHPDRSPWSPNGSEGLLWHRTLDFHRMLSIRRGFHNGQPKTARCSGPYRAISQNKMPLAWPCSPKSEGASCETDLKNSEVGATKSILGYRIPTFRTSIPSLISRIHQTYSYEKAPPPYEKAPPCFRQIWNKGGGFFINRPNLRKFWGFLVRKAS